MASCCDPKAPRVKKILVGGTMVGLVGVDLCLAEVKGLELADESQIAEELVKCVKNRNYIPDSVRGEYSEALLAEYKKQFSSEKDDGNLASVLIEILGTGCKNCNALEKSVEKVVKELGVEAKIVKVEDLAQILARGIMSVPGLILNGKTLSIGRVPTKKEIKAWLEPLKKQ